MKNLIFKSIKLSITIIILSLFLYSCSAAQRHLKNGNYKAAINSGVKTMQKNPKNADKTILAIERAFAIEKIRILDEIHQLKIAGNPGNWERIYILYKDLDRYQKKLKPILPLFIKKEFRNADIQLSNIDQDLADTQLKAAEYIYLFADKLLASGDKIEIRKAYAEFRKVKNLQGNFRDIDDKLQESLNKGQNHILIHYTNDSRLIIPEEFMSEIEAYSPSVLKSDWVSYHFNENDVSEYDYAIEVRMVNVAVGPEQIIESNYEDLKKIQEGYQYVLDSKGNVAKDTLGNDIKKPKFIHVKALVTKIEQTKITSLQSLLIYKNKNKKTILKTTVSEELVFQNFHAFMVGDKRALSSDSKELLGGRPLMFPTDYEMIMDGANLIKNGIINKISKNSYVVFD